MEMGEGRNPGSPESPEATKLLIKMAASAVKLCAGDKQALS